MQNCPFPTHTCVMGTKRTLTQADVKAALVVPLRPIKPKSHPTTSQKSQLTRPAGTWTACCHVGSRTSLQRPFCGVGVREGWRSVLSLQQQPNIAQISATETPGGSQCTISRAMQLWFQLVKTRLGCRKTCRGPADRQGMVLPFSYTQQWSSRNAPPSLRSLCWAQVGLMAMQDAHLRPTLSSVMDKSIKETSHIPGIAAKRW